MMGLLRMGESRRSVRQVGVGERRSCARPRYGCKEGGDDAPSKETGRLYQEESGSIF
jgi:hypothetical protein